MQGVSMRVLSHFLVVAALVTGSTSKAQPRLDVIRGRVTRESGESIGGASVIATRSPDRAVFRTETNGAGEYRLEIADGTGDYLVYIAATGFTPFRKRVVWSAAEAAPVVDARLASATQQLSTIAVRATRLTPARGPDTGPDGPGDAYADGISPGVLGDESGSLAAMVSMMPGFTRTPDGFSAFGLSGSQNAVSLNGMSFPVTDIPRDSRVDMRLSTTPYDPSIGWFSGAQVDLRPIRNGTYSSRTIKASLTGSSQAGSGAPPGPAFAVSYVGNGRLDFSNRYLYSVSAQARRQPADATTLLDSPPTLLQDLHLSADSAAKLFSVAQQLGIPLSAERPASGSLAQSGSVLLRIEQNPTPGGVNIPTAVGLDLYARLAQTSGGGLTPNAAPATAWRNQSGGIVAGLTVSHFAGPEYLVEGQSVLSIGRASRRPYSNLPSARVLIESDLSDGGPGASEVVIGGAATSNTNSLLSWESSAETRFYLPGHNSHRIKATARARFDLQEAESNSAGTFRFESIDDLAKNRAIEFTRGQSGPGVSAGVMNGSLAFGDLWRATDALQLNYGLRFDAATAATSLDRRPDVESRFATETGRVPGSTHVSPRLGFTWRLGRASATTRVTSLATVRLPSRTLRGGIGEFRGITSAGPGVSALTASRQSLAVDCLGDAAPAPDWSAYAANVEAIPTQCRSGSPSNLVDGTAAIHSFAPGMSPSRSWRGNLSYAFRPFGTAVTLDGVVSYNLNQPGWRDLNLALPAGLLQGEQRVMYVNTTVIDLSSGLIAASAARRDASFGKVIEHNSEARSLSRQATISVTPRPLVAQYLFKVAYTLRRTEEDGRGLDATAFGQATTRWTRASTPTHLFQSQFGLVGHGASIVGMASLSSGVFYTPLVGQDVNGDGRRNDRAFLFAANDPANLAAAADLQSLLGRVPTSVRSCLSAQLGGPAGHNSCQGPWSAQFDLLTRLTRPGLRAKRVASLGLAITNVPALADAVLHGDDTRGWGQARFPDPILYHVTGFDPAAGRFNYTVNPKFGSSRAKIGRLTSPFRLTIDISLDLGQPIVRQQFNNIALPGRGGHPGRRFTQAELKTRFAVQVPNVYQLVLQEADSLLLTRGQVDSLTVLRRGYQARIDSIWTDLAQYMDQPDTSFDEGAAYKRQEAAMRDAWSVGWYAVRGMRGLLNDVQMSLLPSWAGTLNRMKAPGNPREAR